MFSCCCSCWCQPTYVKTVSFKQSEQKPNESAQINTNAPSNNPMHGVEPGVQHVQQIDFLAQRFQQLHIVRHDDLEQTKINESKVSIERPSESKDAEISFIETTASTVLSAFSDKIIACIGGYLGGSSKVESFSESILIQTTIDPARIYYVTQDLFRLARVFSFHESELEIGGVTVNEGLLCQIPRYYPFLQKLELSLKDLAKNELDVLDQLQSFRSLRRLTLCDCRGDHVLARFERSVISFLENLQAFELFNTGITPELFLIRSQEKRIQFLATVESIFLRAEKLRWIQIDRLFFMIRSHAENNIQELKDYRKIGRYANLLIFQQNR